MQKTLSAILCQGKLFEEPCTEAVLVTLLLEKVFDNMIGTKRLKEHLRLCKTTKKNILKQNYADMSMVSWKN